MTFKTMGTGTTRCPSVGWRGRRSRAGDPFMGASYTVLCGPLSHTATIGRMCIAYVKWSGSLRSKTVLPENARPPTVGEPDHYVTQ
jgi:hypothetical protein